MTRLTYEALLHRLLPRLSGGIRWGLERTERLLAAVGDPHLAYPVLHVGGTNGKGSVAAYMEACLRHAGLRTGLYTSPHLCSFRERVRVDGHGLSADALVEAAELLWPGFEAESPSFFEGTTALAFLAFARARVQAAVVEVGLGGRLDATNVVAPTVVVLTNVALDHAEFLGETIPAVAREKAGILKPGVPAFTGATAEEALAVLRARASAVAATLVELTPADVSDVRPDATGTAFRMVTDTWGELRLSTSLVGHHQALNAALAVRALEALPPALRPDARAVRQGIAAARWPGRLQMEQIQGVRWLFDVAHNPHAMAALVAALPVLAPPRPLVAVVGILADKDWRAMLGLLREHADLLVLTRPPGAPAERSWDPAAAAHALEGTPHEVAPELDTALARAAARAGGGSVLVTGSFYTVGAAMARLGRAPEGVDPPFAGPPDAPLQPAAGGA